MSETEIVDAVQSINYSVDNLVSNIMDGVKKFKLSYHKASPRKHRDIPTDRDLGIPKLQSLLKYSQQSVDEKDLVVEAMLHNVITSLIHAHYFKGGHFFGVGPEAHHEFLETMFSKLVADGKSRCFFFRKSLFYLFIYFILSPLLTISFLII